MGLGPGESIWVHTIWGQVSPPDWVVEADDDMLVGRYSLVIGDERWSTRVDWSRDVAAGEAEDRKCYSEGEEEEEEGSEECWKREDG